MTMKGKNAGVGCAPQRSREEAVSENVDVIQRGYDAFNSGDAQALAEVFAEDVRWEGSSDERVPGAGTFDGRDDVLAALGRGTEPFDSLSSQPRRVHRAGRHRGRPRPH